jgi:hypothetical protein
LFAGPAQRNDLAVLRNIFGVSNLGDFDVALLQTNLQLSLVS